MKTSNNSQQSVKHNENVHVPSLKLGSAQSCREPDISHVIYVFWATSVAQNTKITWEMAGRCKVREGGSQQEL